MAFWWASQGQNYDTAIVDGTLWSCAWRDGTLRRDRTLLKDMQIGDVVFHYSRSGVRAVSRVAASWVPAPRPSGYSKRNTDDRDEGWLVRVEPIQTGLTIERNELPALVTVGSPGPLDRDGIPQEKYISPLSDTEGQALLERAGIVIEPSTPGVAAASVDEIWELGETDAATIGRRRREQGRLRGYLLGGRDVAACDICGRELPASLLVAAHIVPRSISDEDHRKDFGAIAMLACSLGCDELFELGYVIVDNTGLVRPGRPAESEALQDVVDQLANRTCSAHSKRTAADFAKHATLVLA